ncbi:MAG: group 1 truncated hemoglobin [Lapillicoccus sp.]
MPRLNATAPPSCQFVQRRRETTIIMAIETTTVAPSLYNRLGGVYNIATVVDDLIDRIMSDARLNKDPAVDEAHHRGISGGLHVSGDRDGVLGRRGAAAISGRSMGDSHRHLSITEDEWQAFMDDLHQALAPFDVPAQEEQDLTAIVQSTREAIVVLPPLENEAEPTTAGSAAR